MRDQHLVFESLSIEKLHNIAKMETLLGFSEIDFENHLNDFDLMDCNASFSSCIASSVNSFTDFDDDDGFDSDLLESTTIDSLFDMFEEEVKKMETVGRPSPASSPSSTSSTVVVSETSVIMSSPSKSTSYSLISSSKSRPRLSSSNSPTKRLTSSSSILKPNGAPQCHSTPTKLNQLKTSNASNLPRSLLKKKKKKGVSLLAKPIVKQQQQQAVKSTSILATSSPAKSISQINCMHQDSAMKDQQLRPPQQYHKEEAAKIHKISSTTSSLNVDDNNNNTQTSSHCSKSSTSTSSSSTTSGSTSTSKHNVDMAKFNTYFPLEHDYCSLIVVEDVIAHHSLERSKALLEKVIDLEDDEPIYSRERRKEDGHVEDSIDLPIDILAEATASIASTFI